MRTLLYCLALVLVSPASAGVESLTAKVPSGVKSRITGHSAVDNNTCTAQRVVIKITVAPAHGLVTTEPETKVLPKETPRGGPQPCAGTSIPGIAIFYQPTANFKGEDHFQYLRTNADNPNSKLNGEISYTVNVQ
jgi:hypothetical protein